MGGRVAAIALVPGSRTSFYVGYGTGGVFKTENLGRDFRAGVRQAADCCRSARSPSRTPRGLARLERRGAREGARDAKDDAKGKGKIVWVGTGEGNGRNSSSWGNGVYRSTDGGGDLRRTWASTTTHDIPRIAVDPRDPDVCYVAALGHLWGRTPSAASSRPRTAARPGSTC